MCQANYSSHTGVIPRQVLKRVLGNKQYKAYVQKRSVGTVYVNVLKFHW